MARREDQEKDDRLKRLEDAFDKYYETLTGSSKQMSKTLADYAAEIRKADEHTASFAGTLARLEKELGKSDQVNLVNDSREAIKELNKTIGKFSESEINAIRDLDSLGVAVKELRDQYDQLTKLNAKNQYKLDSSKARMKRRGMSEIEQSLKLEDMREKLLKQQAQLLGISERQYDAIVKGVPKLEQFFTETERGIGSMTRMRAGMDKVVESLQSQVKSFFTFENALNLTKEAFTKSYDQMNKLTNTGLLGAFGEINIQAKRLLMTTDELQKAIEDNRQYINTKYGGGVGGIKAFADDIDFVQKQLMYLGKSSGPAAVKLLELANKSGLAADDQKLFFQNQQKSIDQFKKFNKMYGISADQYQDLMLTQQQEEHVQSRLNNLKGKDLYQYQEELRERTEMLKNLGLSNDQIKEFNNKLETIYDPKKDTYLQQVRESIFMQSAASEMSRALRSAVAKSPEEAERRKNIADNLDKYAPQLQQFFGENVSQDQRREMAKDPEMMKALGAYSAARNEAANSLSPMDKITLSKFAEQGGSADRYADEIGKLVNTAKMRGLDLTGKTPDQLKDILNKNTNLQGEGSVQDFTLQQQTRFYEGVKSTFQDPLAKIAMAVVAAFGAATGAAGILSAALGRAAASLGLPGSLPGATIPKGQPGAPGAGGVNLKALGTGLAGMGLGIASDYGKEHTEVGGVGNAASIIGSFGSSVLSGMGTGATIGSVVPGVGTAVGGAMGAIGGAAYGLWNNWGAAKAWDQVHSASKQQAQSTQPQGGQQQQQQTPPSPTDKYKPMLDLIGKSEGTDRGRGYNETVGYGRFTGGPVDLENMTISQVFSLQDKMLKDPANARTFGKATSAVGRYQIVKKTLLELIGQLGINPDTTKFDKNTQDMLAVALMKKRGIDGALSGQLPIDQFMNNMAKEWASLPMSNGVGYYGGQRAAVTTGQVMDTVASISNGQSGQPSFQSSIPQLATAATGVGATAALSLTSPRTSVSGAASNPLVASRSLANAATPVAASIIPTSLPTQQPAANVVPQVTQPPQIAQAGSLQTYAQSQLPIIVQLDDTSISKLSGFFQKTSVLASNNQPQASLVSSDHSAIGSTISSLIAGFTSSSPKLSDTMPSAPADVRSYSAPLLQPNDTITSLTTQPTATSRVGPIDVNSIVNQATPTKSQTASPEPMVQVTSSSQPGDQMSELKKHTEILTVIANNTTTSMAARRDAYMKDRTSVLNGTS